MKRSSCVVLGLYVLSFFIVVFDALAEDSDLSDSYLHNIEARLIHVDANRIIVEFENNNERIEEGLNSRWYKPLWSVVPKHSSYGIWLRSYEAVVFEGGKKVFEFTNKDSSSPYEVPKEKSIIQYEDKGQFRSVLLAGIRYYPCHRIPGTSSNNTLLIFKKLRVEITFSDAPAASKLGVSTEAIISPLSSSILKPLVVDYEAIGFYALSPLDSERLFEKQIDWVSLINARAVCGPVVKIIVYEPGIYTVRYADLKNAGIRIDELVPERLRLLRKGKEVPIFLDVKKEKKLSRGDTIYFYAVPFDVNKEPYNTYWLIVEPNIEEYPPKRMAVERIDSEEAEEFAAVTSGRSVVREYRKIEYSTSLPLPSPTGRWYWEEIPEGEFRTYSFEIESLAEQAKGSRVQVVLSTKARGKMNQCEVYINRKRVGEMKWSRFAYEKANLTIPDGLLREGRNEISIYVPRSERANVADAVHLLGFEIEYTRDLRRRNNAAHFTVASGEKAGSKVHIQLGGKLTKELRELRVFNVNKAENPVLLPIQIIEGQGASCAVDRSSPRNEYVTATPLTAKRPGEIIPIKELPLSAMSKEASYLIISHRRFISHLKPLVEARRRNGLKVNVVNVEDVYDVFNYGEKSYESIREFLKYVYHKPKKEVLDYVLLVGESSDYVGNPNLLSPEVQEDLVPVWGYGTAGRIVHADNQYTLVCGDDDIPDLAIGRFSVDSIEDVDAYVKKALHYGSQGGFGDWTARHIFITDDEAEFPAIANHIIERQMPDWADVVRIFQAEFPYEDFYRIRNRKRSSVATNRIIKEINEGVLTANYIGHGGPNIWASERLFHIDDAILLNNYDRLTFVTASTCDTAWLDYPTTPVRHSLGELLAKSSRGAAIAVFAPTTGASSEDHKFLMDYLYNGLFEHNLVRFGDSILYAKVVFYMERRNTLVVNQFVLLGDPYLTFSAVSEPSVNLTVSPPTSSACLPRIVRVEGKTPEPLWGWAKIFLKKPKGKSKLLERYARVFNGRFAFDYTLEENAPEDKFLFVAYAYNDLKKKSFWGAKEFAIDKPRIEVSARCEKPSGREHLFEGDEAIIIIEVKNLTDIHHKQAMLEVYRGSLSEPMVTRQIELSPRASLTQTFKSGTVAGVHYFRINVRPELEAGECPVFSEDLFWVVESNSERPFLIVNPKEIRTKPERLVRGNKPRFDFTVHNLSKEPQRDVQCSLGFVDGETISEKNIEIIPAHSSVPVNFALETSMSPGEYPVQVLLLTAPSTGTATRYQFSSKRTVKVNEIADLIVVPESVRFESEHFLNGETVYIKALIRNMGEETARDFMVEAFVDEPWNRSKVIENASKTPNVEVSSLAPEEEREVRIRWDRLGPPKGFEVFVVANSKKQVRETNYANNVATKRIVFRRHGNLSLPMEEVDVSRRLARRGDKVNIRFSVVNTGEPEMPEVPIEFYEYSLGHKPGRYGETISSDSLPPDGREDISIIWKPSGYVNVFKVMANPNREIQEDNYDDNTLELKFDYVLSWGDLKPSSDGYCRLGDYIKLGDAEFALFDPSGKISCTEFTEASGKVVDVSPELLAEPLPEGKAGVSGDLDNQWSLRRRWLEASPKEDPAPVRFEFPMERGDGSTVYDVYIYVQSSGRYKGFPSTKLRLECEGSGKFEMYDFSKKPGAYPTQRYYIGRFDIADGFFDVAIDDAGDECWTIVNHFEFVPVKSVYTSPPVDVEKRFFRSRKVQFKMKSLAGKGSHVVARFRSGKEHGDFDISWEPWQTISSSDKGLSPWYEVDRNIMQWQVELCPSLKGSPEMEDFGFRIE